MNIITRLKNNYITVKDACEYGGSQNLFKNSSSLFAKGKVQGGCGVVALADTIAYLQKDTSFESDEDYRKYFNLIASRMLYLSTKLGMSFIHMYIGALCLFRRYGLKYHLFWTFNLRRLYPRVKKMLDEDIPVILCIPKIYGVGKAKRGLELLNPDDKSVLCRTYGHFVVVTGIYDDEGKMYFEISSWGKRYMIEYGEFVRFSKKTPAGLLGHMLYIK